MRKDRSCRRRAARACAAGLLLALFALGGSAQADGRRTAPADPGYAAECGSCHLPYPPRLLSAASWGRVMQGLDKHFGSDASVDAESFARIERYLREHAGPERKFGTSALRITETEWFRREHKEVPAGTWKSSAVKSAANCGACHVAADKGDYGERSVRVPRF
jgi:nitrate/TMAO reductase-like tetraheme cytochrome c subunit